MKLFLSVPSTQMLLEKPNWLLKRGVSPTLQDIGTKE
jgi:hypothetical protein